MAPCGDFLQAPCTQHLQPLCSLSCVPPLRGSSTIQMLAMSQTWVSFLLLSSPVFMQSPVLMFLPLVLLEFLFQPVPGHFISSLLPYSSLILILSPFFGYSKLFKLYLGILRKDQMTSYYLLPPPLNISSSPVILTTQHLLSNFSIC